MKFFCRAVNFQRVSGLLPSNRAEKLVEMSCFAYFTLSKFAPKFSFESAASTESIRHPEFEESFIPSTIKLHTFSAKKVK